MNSRCRNHRAFEINRRRLVRSGSQHIGRLNPTASYTNLIPHPEGPAQQASRRTRSQIPLFRASWFSERCAASSRDARAALLTMRRYDAVGLMRPCPPPSCASRGGGIRLAQRLPHLHRGQRRMQVSDAGCAERIHHRIDHAGRTTDRAGFAATLGAERIGAAGR